MEIKIAKSNKEEWLEIIKSYLTLFESIEIYLIGSLYIYNEWNMVIIRDESSRYLNKSLGKLHHWTLP
jgi:hypothetical protein